MSEHYLSNAERLFSDAEFLLANGRSRSAATLIVVGLEQLGANVEARTLQEYPDAEIYMGLFDKRNSHAKRQDALAGHVLNSAIARFWSKILVGAYAAEHGALDDDQQFMNWLSSGNKSFELSVEQQEEWANCPELAAAHRLLHLTRTGALKALREYGLYEDGKRQFSDAEIKLVLDLASKVRAILARSIVFPEAPKMAGVNMPHGVLLDAGQDDALKPVTFIEP